MFALAMLAPSLPSIEPPWAAVIQPPRVSTTTPADRYPPDVTFIYILPYCLLSASLFNSSSNWFYFICVVTLSPFLCLFLSHATRSSRHSDIFQNIMANVHINELMTDEDFIQTIEDMQINEDSQLGDLLSELTSLVYTN